MSSILKITIFIFFTQIFVQHALEIYTPWKWRGHIRIRKCQKTSKFDVLETSKLSTWQLDVCFLQVFPTPMKTRGVHPVSCIRLHVFSFRSISIPIRLRLCTTRGNCFVSSPFTTQKLSKVIHGHRALRGRS